MDRLESCYFCGTGDGSLDEYPVVPDSLSPSPDEQATVTLCPSCRRKLASVVKRIADVAAGAPDIEREPAAGDAAAPAGASPEPAEPIDRIESSPDEAAPPDEGDTPVEADEIDAGDDDAGAGGATDADDEAGADAAPESISPFQYNKVMRLLENREFPVSVAEFESIATSAYQLDPSEVESVIQAAVDRGLLELDEEEETLHRAG